MRRHVVLLFFLMNILFLSAQEKEKFYAVDGSEWVTEEERNIAEKRLWDDIEEGIRRGKIPPDYSGDKNRLIRVTNSLAGFVDKIKDAVETLRTQDQNLEELLTPEVLEALNSQEETKLEKTRATNKELFQMKELAELYNLYLQAFNDLYRFSEKLKQNSVSEDLSEYESFAKYTLIPLSKKMELTSMLLQAKAYAITTMAALYTMEQAKKSFEELPKEEGSVLSINYKPEFYYSIDGKKYKTQKGRDNREKKILENTRNLYTSFVNEEILSDDQAKEIISKLDDTYEITYHLRLRNNELYELSNDSLRAVVQKQLPNVDMTPSVARNGEICFLPEIKTFYDAMIGRSEIITALAEYINKELQKSKKNQEKKTNRPIIQATITFSEQKDSTGKTYEDLTGEAGEALPVLKEKSAQIRQTIKQLNK